MGHRRLPRWLWSTVEVTAGSLCSIPMFVTWFSPGLSFWDNQTWSQADFLLLLLFQQGSGDNRLSSFLSSSSWCVRAHVCSPLFTYISAAVKVSFTYISAALSRWWPLFPNREIWGFHPIFTYISIVAAVAIATLLSTGAGSRPCSFPLRQWWETHHHCCLASPHSYYLLRVEIETGRKEWWFEQ